MERGGIPTTRGAALAALAALAAVFGPVAADAQQQDSAQIDSPYRWIPRGFRVGLVGGYVDGDLSSLGLGPQSTPVFGARARIRISAPLSLEGSVLYGDSERTVVDPRLPSGPTAVDTVNSQWILPQAAVQFAVTGNRTWHGLQPFLMIGGGFLIGIDEETSPALTGDEGDRLRHDIEVMPAMQGGAGVEWLFSDRFGLSFEARDYLWRITTPDGFFDEEVVERIREADTPAPQETEWTHNFEFSVSIYHYF